MIDAKLFDRVRKSASESSDVRYLLDIIHSTLFTHLGEVCIVDGISPNSEKFSELETILMAAHFANSDRDECVI